MEKSKRIHYWTPPSWFHAVNCLETGSQGLIRTGYGLSNGIRPSKTIPDEGRCHVDGKAGEGGGAENIRAGVTSVE